MKRLVAIGTATVLLCISCILPGIQSDASEVDTETARNAEELDQNQEQEDVLDDEASDEGTQDGEIPDEETPDEDMGEEEQIPSVSYETHVQTIGWQQPVKDGELAGTEGKALRMEGVRINLENVPEDQGGIEYSAHVQSIGWQEYVSGGEVAGTTGRKLRVEAVKIRLTGQLAEEYDVYYRTHIQSYGWLGWAKNGQGSGSMEHAKRMEAIQICLIKKGEPAPGDETNSYIYPRITYQIHEQSYGWMGKAFDDELGGVTGKAKRVEALKINLPDHEYEGGVEYRTYVQGIGWQDWVQNGQQAGTTGQTKRVEAIEIRLTGEMAEHYSVYYSVHMSKVGWTNYAQDGETAGSIELSKRIEAIRIRLVKEGEEAPDTSGVKFVRGFGKSNLYYNGIIQKDGQSEDVISGETLGTIGEAKRLESMAIFLNNTEEGFPQGDIRYATHLSGIGWQSETGTGEVNGCTDGTHGIEAVKISLTGDLAMYYDVYYRAHVEKYGWLGWAKNGQVAGTATIGYRLEALQIRLVSKDAGAPGANRNYYTETRKRVYQNPPQYYQIKDKITLTGGGYNLSYGFEGIKVRKVIQRLGLGSGVGMGGAFYGTSVQNAVRNFQRQKGLSQTGVVDLLTWTRMGFSQAEWEIYGAYVSPIRVNASSTRSQHIEAMISRAYEYLGDDYVIGASSAPGYGVDCSGLVMQALYAAGLDLSPITPVSHAQPGHEYESRNMWASSRFMHVSYSQRQRGDLIFYQNSAGTVIHVAIYLGNNQVIEAWPNKVVVWPIQNGSRSNIKGVVRPFV